MKNILVIFGGKSVEHDISIITAMQVLKNLPKGYNFLPIYIDRDGHWWMADNLDKPQTFLNFSQNAIHRRACTLICGENMLCEVKKGKFKNPRFVDGALLCCHGGDGEGGALQGLLKMCKIPFTSPDFKSSVVCMDKVLTKLALRQNNIKVVDFVSFVYQDFANNKNYYISKIEKELGYPLIVKPARLGSSVGVHICSDRAQLLSNIDFAKEYDSKILVEKYIISSKEFACACMQVNGKIICSQVHEIKKGKIYSFKEKYLSSSQDNKKINKTTQDNIKKLTIATYKYLECDGLVRVDFLYSPSSKTMYVCEVNTIPGSLSCNLFGGVAFHDLISNLIEECSQNAKRQDELIYNFNSDAIKRYIEICNVHKLSKQ